MENMPYPSNYFDPYGDEKNCPVCDAVMGRDSSGELYCLQYHEEDLTSQKDYIEKGALCPVCGSNRTDVPDEADLNWAPVKISVGVKCLTCKATWNEFYKFDRYEMVGTK